MKIFSFVFLFIPIMACAAGPSNNDGFLYQGKPINAPCVAAFNYSVTDLPAITSIHLLACGHDQTTHTKPHGVYYFYKNNKDTQEGTYQYQVLGKTQQGVYVLETAFDTGGTFSMDELLFLTLTHDQLKRVGYWVGNFCGIHEVKISGNTVQFTQDLGTNVNECGKQVKRYQVDLTKLN